MNPHEKSKIPAYVHREGGPKTFFESESVKTIEFHKTLQSVK